MRLGVDFDTDRTAFERRLDFCSAAPVCVAFSGGPDSFEALRRTLAATARPVIALHVDHGLDPHSGAWGDRAESLARSLGAQFRRLAWTGAKPATGVPAAAREARHRLLAQAAREAGAKVIVTGHTGDDALENAAMGLGSLAEWSPSPLWPEGRGLFLLRPLLDDRRGAIRDRLAAEGLLATLVDDPANKDPRHPRIAARAIIAGSGSVPSRSHAPVAWRQADILPGGAIRFPRASVSQRLLAAALASAGGKPGVPRRERVERLVDALARPGPVKATLAGAQLIAMDEGVLIVRDAGETARGGLPALRLACGETGVFDGRFEISAAHEPVEIRPLKGRAAALSAAERSALAGVPAAARPALPQIATKTKVSCPILAECPGVTVTPLVGERFLAGCGAIAHEGGI